MPRLQCFLECLGQALCEKGRRALDGRWPFSDVLPSVAKDTLDLLNKRLGGTEIWHAIQDAAAVDATDHMRRIQQVIEKLSRSFSVPQGPELCDYMQVIPSIVRQVLRRPSDPAGVTVPEGIQFYKPEDLLVYLPPRLPRFHPGTKPHGLDGWELVELCGLGECSEVWRGENPNRPEESPAALKFATDAGAHQAVTKAVDLFHKVFELNGLSGVVSLRNVYLGTDPPCMESPFIRGYDLAGVIRELRWRYPGPKVDAVLKMMKRLVMVVAEAHARDVVHRDLKPSNVLIHPTDGGKFTLWVSDFGWGQIEAERSRDLHKKAGKAANPYLAFRGADSGLYSSPQQYKGDPPALTDDIYALGVIWYQMLMRDPHLPAPVDMSWAEELRAFGFTDSQAKLLQSCISPRAEERPHDAVDLSERLGTVTIGPSTAKSVGSNSSVMTHKGLSGSHPVTKLTPPPTITNSTAMRFVRVPAGEFEMGAPESERGSKSSERPQHTVRFPEAFYLSATPITQAQFDRVFAEAPSYFSRARGGGPDHPVENITWESAKEFCVALGELPEERTAGRKYRLPTEAEWEYACRAGTTTPFSFGERMTALETIFACPTGGKYCGKSTAPVGQRPANAWGLYDMHGNVREWCADWFAPDYYKHSPEENPTGPAEGAFRVVRGGSFSSPMADCRSSARVGHPADQPAKDLGFRIVLVG